MPGTGTGTFRSPLHPVLRRQSITWTVRQKPSVFGGEARDGRISADPLPVWATQRDSGIYLGSRWESGAGRGAGCVQLDLKNDSSDKKTPQKDGSYDASVE